MRLNTLKPAQWEVWLPLLAVFVLPFGRSVEVIVLIMAIIGIYDLFNDTNGLKSSPQLKVFTVFFLCFWLPALISLFDAVNLAHSTENVLGSLRFYFAGLFIINRLSSPSHLWLGIGIAAILAFWSFDAWVQLLLGKDLFGLASHSVNRISGIFGKYAMLGLMIIPFMGAAIVAIQEKSNILYTSIFSLFIASAILISGDRSAWISLFAGIVIFLVFFRPKSFAITRKQLMLIILGVTVTIGAVINTPQFKSRLDNSLLAFHGGYQSLNQASSLRLPIWETAIRIFADHPINGVGARGFRYAYPDYANDNDLFVDFTLPREKQTGQTHAHQIVLEFMSDTGMIGLLGYIVGLSIIFFKWRLLAQTSQSTISTGYIVSLLAILFPLNSHLSFYSSNWAQVVWFIVALSVSALYSDKQIIVKPQG
ncbi:MAG: O-antigen ligase family protein [Gammaproteobacteria bacterium]|nr:O-antigen ligase family protein [Gammaproteobacteria bacterium]